MKKAFTAAVLITLALVLTILPGCSTDADTNATASAGTTAQATTKPTDQATAAPTPDPASQFQFPWTGDPVTISYYYVDFSYAGMVSDPTKLIDKAFQDVLGNVTIDNQSVGWADYGTKLDLMFSSGEMADIIIAGGTYATKYGDSGFLLDFTPYLDYLPNFQVMYAKYPATYKIVGEQILAIQQPRDTTIISKEWIANDYYVKQGIAIPTTYDEVYESCKQVKELNPDSYPLNFCWGGLFLNDFNTNSGVFYNNDTGEWEWGLMSDDFRDYVDFMSTMYAEKLMHPNQYDSDWGDQWLSIITDPTSWFLYSGYNEVNDLKIPQMLEKKSDFAVDYMLPPTAGDNHVWIPIEAQPGTDTYFTYCPAQADNPEFLCSFLNYMMSDEVGVLVNWGIEDETFTVNADGVKSFASDLILPSNPSKGTVDPISTLSLYPHFMCKQLGTVTRTDFDAMTAFHVDASCGARSAQYAQYIQEHPDCAKWNQPLPTLSSEESALVSALMTDISTYVDEQVQLFILGQRDMSEWDLFLEEVKDIGDGQIVADLYNSKPQIVLVN